MSDRSAHRLRGHSGLVKFDRHFLGNLSVGGCLSIRNIAEKPPDLLTERFAGGSQG